MSGPHRIKSRKTMKLHGPKYPYNSQFTESDPLSQSSLTPIHQLSLSASEARGTKSRRLVSQEYSKLSLSDRALLEDWVGEPVCDGDNLNDADFVDLPEHIANNESESFIRSIVPPARYRSWIERTHNASAAWDNQLEDLVDAYLRFKDSTASNGEPLTSIVIDGDSSETEETFTVETVDVFVRHSGVIVTHSCQGGRNVALVRSGYISSSPTNPTSAISIRTLDLFRLLRQRQPQLSVQAFTKVLCDLHFVPYKRYLRDQLSTALDVYFSILRIVESRVLVELRRDGPDWLLKNVCPACTYKLKNKPELVYSMILAGDGNTSLKRYLQSGENDPRRFIDARMLEPEYVDQFTLDKESNNEVDGDSVDASPCAPRWKNARNENAKNSFEALDETGVFTVLCRHGLVLVIADMIKSGERAKYPLATFSKVIQAHGNNILIGYDIGCQHSITAGNHPKTRDLICESHAEYAVGAFHGYAHERLCQLNWHPLWRSGAGMEDLETCERWFSHSNGVAQCTQHGTKYNRRLQIQQHVAVSDRDALANLGKFLYNNLVSATSQLEESLEHRDQAMHQFGLTLDDFKLFIDQERQYLSSPPIDSSGDTDVIEYLNTLEEIETCQTEIDKFNASPVSAVSKSKHPINIDNAIASRRRYLTNRVLLHMKNAYELEVKLDISLRWTKGSPDWAKAEDCRQTNRLKSVAKNLERLCLERIFEMEKYLHGNTGYKLRELISKGLADRSKALKSAVQEYNELARSAVPPRQEISMSKVMELTKVSDFKLLQEH